MSFIKVMVFGLCAVMPMQASDLKCPIWVQCVGLGCASIAAGAFGGYLVAKHAAYKDLQEKDADSQLAKARIENEAAKVSAIQKLQEENKVQEASIIALQKQLAALHQQFHACHTVVSRSAEDRSSAIPEEDDHDFRPVFASKACRNSHEGSTITHVGRVDCIGLEQDHGAGTGLIAHSSSIYQGSLVASPVGVQARL